MDHSANITQKTLYSQKKIPQTAKTPLDEQTQDPGPEIKKKPILKLIPSLNVPIP